MHLDQIGKIENVLAVTKTNLTSNLQQGISHLIEGGCTSDYNNVKKNNIPTEAVSNII